MRQNENISLIAKEALERGGGRACVATHGNGCRHYGILDLSAMNSKNYMFYSKPGFWLDGKTCMVCKIDTKDMALDKVTKCYLRYCEMGLKGSKYNADGNQDDMKSYLDHNCSMVLCVKCWNSKVLEHEQEIKAKFGVVSNCVSARKKIG